MKITVTQFKKCLDKFCLFNKHFQLYLFFLY